MKFMRAISVLAVAAFIAAPAFAETQNVKVSGSIDAYAFNRDNYDLLDSNDAGVLPVTASVPGQSHSGNQALRSESDNYFRTNTQIEVSADLTNNVSTVINLVNQRDWNGEPVSTVPASVSQTNNEFDIELDLAYVQMKEIFYSPLTLTIGRQDVWFGRGLVIGNNNTAWDTQNTVQADEYSVSTAFDAVRATLDFNPWTIDFVYSKIDENSDNSEDDTDLYITNINYKFAEYNAVAEGYYVEQNVGSTALTTESSNTSTLGGRVQFDPISQITLGGELAWQGGKTAATPGVPDRDRDAWMVDLFGTYRWDNTWKPELTLEYVSFSGEDDLSATSGDFNGWNGLYRGKFWTAYGDFREFVYATADAVDQSATTNTNLFQVKGSLKPLEDLLLEGSFTYFWNDEDVHVTSGVQSSSTRSKDIGWEIDLQATYDYTEDVSFGILAGWFTPGDFYVSPGDETATDLVSSVKVSF